MIEISAEQVPIQSVKVGDYFISSTAKCTLKLVEIVPERQGAVVNAYVLRFRTLGVAGEGTNSRHENRFAPDAVLPRVLKVEEAFRLEG